VLLSSPESGKGIDPGSPASRHQGSQQNDRQNSARNGKIRHEIEWFQTEKQAVYGSTGGQRTGLNGGTHHHL